MKTLIFYLIQFTWVLPVNLISCIMYIILTLGGCKRERFYNAFVIYIPSRRFSYGVSLGVFIFITVKAAKSMEECQKADMLVHEYGHTYQALILGPLYWFVVGIPSFIWMCFFVRYRINNNISYYDFYTEAWANSLGQKYTS